MARHAPPSLVVAAGALVLAVLSLLAPHAPGYDPWAWLIWGREVAQGGLDTVDGPAFKPLPVAVDALLWRVLGDGGAPTAWLLLARTAALAGAGFAGLLAHWLAGGSWAAGAVAAVGVLLTTGFAANGAIGNVEGAALALGVLAVGLALDGRPRAALAVGAALGLLRPESWPLLLGYGLWAARRDPGLRTGLSVGTVLVLAAWFVPEWLGSGDPLRSGDRARVPNPGQPATEAVPGWAALRAGLALPLLPLLLLALAAPGRARVPALLGLAWIVEVALMAQLLGTSGEPRYSLPGAALIAVSGAVGAVTLARRAVAMPVSVVNHAHGAEKTTLIEVPASGRAIPAALALALVVAAALRVGGTAGELRRAGEDARLAAALPVAIADAGGRDRVLACGRPVVGRYRGPLTAWALRVPKRVVQTPTGRGGAVLRSRIRPGQRVQPPAPAGARLLGTSSHWRLEGRC